MGTLECRECGAPLDVEYLESADGAMPRPMHDPDAALSLGEGDTPVVDLPRVGEALGLERLRAKLEFMNPTGSYKDRGTATMLSVAREHGITEIVEDSSGNAGASVSAYAARAGIKAHIFAPATAPEAKLKQIRVYGAEVHAIEGSRGDVTDAAVAFYRERGLVYASHNMSPYFVEGTKTFAYEMVDQTADEPPDHVVMPVGNGALYIGLWKGLQEMRSEQREIVIPRLHLVQTEAVRPLVSAFQSEQWDPASADRTIAGGIAVVNPPRLEQIMVVLRESDGVAVAIGDSDIVPMQLELARTEGVYCEPTSAAAFVGLRRLVDDGVIMPDETVLVAVTGFGLKDEAPV